MSKIARRKLTSDFAGSSFARYQFKGRHAKKLFWLKLISIITSVLLVGIVLFVIFTIVAFAIFTKDLPSPYKLTSRDVSQSTKIFDRNGTLLYDIFGDQNRTLVQLQDVPEYVKQASISTEDKDFYKHKGFATRGIIRALFEIIVHHRLQGGSTITQQVVKNTLLSPERTIPRKIREFILSIQVEKRYSKDEILQIYLNEVSYGGTAVGIEAAAETYFNKKAKDLTLTEAIILAGLPQKPSAYSPFGSNPKAYIERATEVARRMREDEKISKEQEKQIVAELANIKFSVPGHGIKAPHFVLYVRDLLEERYGTRVVEQGGLQVKTSLDLKLQEEVQKIVSEEVAKLGKLKVGNGAAIVRDPKTGEILAMVGSKDYFANDYDGNVNVTLSKRQPGSSIKPINYASAFRQGYSPSFMMMDVSTEFPGGRSQPAYRPVNYDGKFHGPVQVRYALGNSYNIPAVKMLALGGIKNMLSLASDMGLSTLTPTNENLNRFGLSLTLGGGEITLLDMTTAFGVFATYGYKNDPVSILKVTDSSNKTLEEFRPNNGKRALSEEISFLISSILSDNGARSEAFGGGGLLNIAGKTVAVKTGTTDDKRDNWTIGFTKSIVVGVWVGNNDNSPMHPSLTSGVTGAAPIWNRVMRFAIKDLPNEQFGKPDGVIQSNVDLLDGGAPCRGLPTRSEYFVKGTEPKKSCIGHKYAGGIEYLVFHEDDPASSDGKNRWQEGIDAWIATQPDQKYHPPAGTQFENEQQSSQNSNDNINVKITKPNANAKIDGTFEIESEVESSLEMAIVELKIEGGVVASTTNSPYKFSYTFPGSSSGNKTIEVLATAKNGKTGSASITVEVE